jgi:hypothetical protein
MMRGIGESMRRAGMGDRRGFLAGTFHCVKVDSNRSTTWQSVRCTSKVSASQCRLAGLKGISGATRGTLASPSAFRRRIYSQPMSIAHSCDSFAEVA